MFRADRGAGIRGKVPTILFNTFSTSEGGRIIMKKFLIPKIFSIMVDALVKSRNWCNGLI